MSWERAAQLLAHALEETGASENLAEIVLLIGVGECPDLDARASLGILEQHASDVRATLSGGAKRTPMEEIAALNDVLFERYGYTGDADEYYSPDNSYLHRVIDRRRGMPITLSVIYCDVARRAGIPMVGIGFPGHFLARYAGAVPRVIVDPFNAGRIVTAAECLELLRGAYGEPRALEPAMFDEATPRDIVVRILRNLKGAFLRAEELPRARSALDCLLTLAPDLISEWRERGLVRIKMEDASGALNDLRHFAVHAEPGPEADEVDDLIASLRAHLARLN